MKTSTSGSVNKPSWPSFLFRGKKLLGAYRHGRDWGDVPTTIKLSSPATREFWEIPVLFEDEHLLALDKPALLLTSPDRGDPERPSLLKLLHQHIERGAPWATTRGLSYLM